MSFWEKQAYSSTAALEDVYPFLDSSAEIDLLSKKI
jgi:hypothetical protein